MLANQSDPQWDTGARGAVTLAELSRRLGVGQLIGDAVVSGVSADSRTVRSGDLFLAYAGGHHDGHHFAREALRRGAAALVVEHIVDVVAPQLVVPSVSRVAGPLSAVVYGEPSHHLEVVGVTGTNGKTTTSQLLRACLGTSTRPAAQIGTTGVYFGDELLADSSLSTPEAPDLQRQLAELSRRGAQRIAIEVTSHGLHRHRVDGTHFRVGVFLNLSPEHLDYHKTMEDYFEAKSRMFEPGRCEEAVVCVDDEWGRRLAAHCQIPVTTFGRDDAADVRVDVRSFGLKGLGIRLSGESVDVEIYSRMIGQVNANNIAAAFLAARSLGVDEATCSAAIESCAAPPGRFEILTSHEPYLVVADYAHTPDALRALIATAREVSPGRVFVVFGSRGERYVDKRPEMARCATRADHVWLTTDSPGDEDANAIMAATLSGFSAEHRDQVSVVADRSLAIRRAVEVLRLGDVLLMTGRGPETTQRFGDRLEVLDDRVVARLALDARRRVVAPSPFETSVTVVVAAHNAQSTLRSALTSLLVQTCPVDEIVVVDDGSDDGTVEVARSFGPKVKVVHQPHHGSAAARNTGVACSTGRWLAFMEADGEWSPRRVESQLIALCDNDAVLCGAAAASTTDATLDRPMPLDGSAPERGAAELLDTASVMVRRDIFGRLGGFKPGLDDLGSPDLWRRASGLGGVVKLVR